MNTYFAGAHRPRMMLGHALAAVKHEWVPHLLQHRRAVDAVVFENILTVLQDAIPCTNILKIVVRVHRVLCEIQKINKIKGASSPR